MAVLRSGGRPFRVTPGSSAAARSFDALVLGGGADVVAPPGAPPLERDEVRLARHAIGKMKQPGALGLLPLVWLARRLFSIGAPEAVDPRRDAMERALIGRALRHGCPILGICRGAQLLNVYFAGTLHRDVAGFYTESPPVQTVLPRKRIVIKPGSRLASLLGPGDCHVNALNRQSVDALGEGIRVVAREANGLVQAIERAGSPMIVGVQWHPEFLPQIRRQRRLFAGLVREARFRGRRASARSWPAETGGEAGAV